MHDPRAAEPAAVATLVAALVVLFGAVLVGPAVAVDATASGSHDAGVPASDAVPVAPALATDTPSLLTGTPTPTATATATDGSAPTPTPDTLSEVANETENTTGTVTNTTGSVTNTTETVTNTTGSVANTTKTVTNTTGSVSNTTDSVTNATEEVTNTTNSVTNTTGSVTNTTGSVTNSTGAVTNTTGAVTDETGGLVDDTTDLTETVTAGANVSVGVGSAPTAGSTGTASSPSGTATTGTAGSAASTAAGDSTGTRSGPVTAAVPPGGRGGDGSGPVPSPGGAAVGGIIVVASVLAAAASKQVAAATSVAQGQELAWLARAAWTRLHATTGTVRALLGRLPRLFVPVGYSRYDDSDPLEHGVRESLFQTVERSPGVNLSTLADGVDASLSSVRHHLRILEEENLLVSERIRGQRRYFLSNESEPELVAALDDAATEPILRALARSGPASVSELADDLGRDPSTISHHVSRLEDDGLVERERDGQSVRNSLAPVAERVLAQRAGGRSRPVATE